MITFVLQTLDWGLYGQAHYFVLFFLYVWVVWSVKSFFSRFYKEANEEYNGKVSVVIPAYKEDLTLFDRVVSSIKENSPHELIVVVDGGDGVLTTIARQYTEDVYKIRKSGKRLALSIGFRVATGDIVVIVDSDTVWIPTTLRELLKPFNNPKVGGVTTNQRILDPDRNLVRRFCDWMEDLRFTISTPAQSYFGTVGCLPGRTIAFRRGLLLGVLNEFLNERFLGAWLEVGDDRCLTNFALKKGWKTVFQRSAYVYTDAPDAWRDFVRQQTRWARSSQRETLRQLSWLVKKPFLAFCFLTDIITPFFLTGVFVNILLRLAQGTARMPIIEGTSLESLSAQVVIAAVGITISIGMRQIPHFRSKPQDLLFLPVFVAVLTFLLIPIRIWGFMTMTESKWLTR